MCKSGSTSERIVLVVTAFVTGRPGVAEEYLVVVTQTNSVLYSRESARVQVAGSTNLSVCSRLMLESF